MRVIVAGGGIVGLTAGAALRWAGAEVVVCEQAEEVRAAGASIGLWTNALEVFGAVGIREPVEALGTGVSTWFYDAAGRPHRAADSSEADHAFLLVPRPELNQTLADAVGREINAYFLLSAALSQSRPLQHGDMSGFAEQARATLAEARAPVPVRQVLTVDRTVVSGAAHRRWARKARVDARRA